MEPPSPEFRTTSGYSFSVVFIYSFGNENKE